MESPDHHATARTDSVEDPVKAGATRERGPSAARRLDGDETETIIECVMVRLGLALESDTEADQGRDLPCREASPLQAYAPGDVAEGRNAGRAVRSDAQRRIDDRAVCGRRLLP